MLGRVEVWLHLFSKVHLKFVLTKVSNDRPIVVIDICDIKIINSYIAVGRSHILIASLSRVSVFMFSRGMFL